MKFLDASYQQITLKTIGKIVAGVLKTPILDVLLIKHPKADNTFYEELRLASCKATGMRRLGWRYLRNNVHPSYIPIVESLKHRGITIHTS